MRGKEPKEIWMVTREFKGIAESGGLKDVVRELSVTLAELGYDLKVVIPFYSFIKQEGCEYTGIQFAFPLPYKEDRLRTEWMQVWKRKIEGVTIYFLDTPRYREKEGIYTYSEREAIRLGNPYLKGQSYYDYFAMNLALEKGALELIQHIDAHPDIIHLHDGHTALISAFIEEIPRYKYYFRNTATVLTIHNAGLAYHQSVDDFEFALDSTELPFELLTQGILNGQVDPLVIGGLKAQVVNTVSENYAWEIMNNPEEDMRTGGLGTIYKRYGIELKGITNGIDVRSYDPMDPSLGLPATFNPRKVELEGKYICKRELIAKINQRQYSGIKYWGYISEEYINYPMIGVISRITEQKGIDLLIAALEQLISSGEEVLFVILGLGEWHLEERLKRITLDTNFFGKVIYLQGYSEKLSLLIYGASDFFVNPALFEPCGLTDFISLLFGTVPIVHCVGGLVKVKDSITGYSYKEHSPHALVTTIRRALLNWKNNPQFHKDLIKNGIEDIYKNYTWEKVAINGYIPLYREALKIKTRKATHV